MSFDQSDCDLLNKALAERGSKKRLVLKDFELNEISAVDKPAQPTALATIIKLDESKPDAPVDIHKAVAELARQRASVTHGGYYAAYAEILKENPELYNDR